MGRKTKIAGQLISIYTYFINQYSVYLTDDRVYYQRKDKSWTYVDKESSIEEHNKNKEFLVVAMISGVLPKT